MELCEEMRIAKIENARAFSVFARSTLDLSKALILSTIRLGQNIVISAIVLCNFEEIFLDFSV